MKQIRILNETYKEIRDDLSRSHPHAFERVGFAFIRTAGDAALVMTGYLPVPDEHYIVDTTVGARINHKAIAMAMKRADHQKEGILHVHEHGGRDIPLFSKTDVNSHPEFLRSFRNANPLGIHGFLLLSKNDLVVRFWQPSETAHQTSSRYTLVGSSLLPRWFRKVTP
jgi:hypothetical protein